MSLSTQQDTDILPSSAPPDTAGKAQPLLPWKAWKSLFRQRFILRIRWWFRLESDDIKERNTQQQINGLLQLNDAANSTIQSLSRIVENMHQRLSLYEKEMPAMRRLKRQFDLEQAGLRSKAAATREDLSNGILPMRKE